MQVTVFAKQKSTKEGKTFYTYFATLKKKDGSELVTELKFKELAGSPKGEQCPMNIVFDKTDANFTERPVTYEKDGEEKDAITRKLWIRKWEEGEPYVDHSMDDFE